MTEYSHLCFFKKSFLLPVPLSLPHCAVFSLSFWYSVCWSLSLGGPSSEVEGDRALAGYGALWRGERDRGRRPRQYIYPGESRKTSERFRTQPITSAERQETDRYCSGLKNAWLRVKNAEKISTVYDHACQKENIQYIMLILYLMHVIMHFIICLFQSGFGALI